jgi:CO dehydrogenase/acetyl-CoA synthase alpha subunit
MGHRWYNYFMKYFVLFRRQEGQLTHAYSLVSKEILETIPKDIIKKVKEVGDVGIATKEQLKEWVEELGGVWYGNN